MNAEVASPSPNDAFGLEALAVALDEKMAAAPAADPAKPDAGADAPSAEAEVETPPAEAGETKPAEETVEALSQETETETEGTEAPDTADLSPEARKRLGEVVADRLGKAKAKFDEKLTAAERLAAEAEAKRAALEKQVEELKAKPPELVPALPANPNNPLREVKDLAELEKQAQKAQAVVDDIDALLPELTESPDSVAAKLQRFGIKLTDADGQPDYSERRMRGWLERTRLEHERIVSRHVPEQRRALEGATQFRQVRAEADAIAEKDFPWLKDAKDARTVKVNEVLRTRPALAQVPDARLLLAAAMETIAGRQKPAGVAPAKPKAVAAKPQVVAGQAAAKPSTPADGRGAASAAWKRYAETGSDEDYHKAIDAEESVKRRPH